MIKKHKKYIQRTFYLAKKGLGKVFPNPLVGCVIVKNNKIIGEGYHKKYGGNHAEVNAINSVKDKKQINDSSVYINLEPCSHYGKTPPCVDRLIMHKPKEVIISNIDLNPKVNGGGIKKLVAKNIKVIEGVEENVGKIINKRFFVNQNNKMPYIILKWAQTQDGFIAKQNGESKWISNLLSRKLVHKWRSEEKGILVGVNTANIDNPKLNVRYWKGKNPVRIILDPHNKLIKNQKVLNDTISTLIYNIKHNKKTNNKYFVKTNPFKLDTIFSDLYKRGITSVLVEGGLSTIHHILSNNLWNEARVFVSEKKFTRGIKAPKLKINKNKFITIKDDKLYIIRNGS